MLDAVATIIRYRARFDSELARVQEHRPELSAFDAQLEAKKRCVQAAPGGRELWARFEQIRRRALERPGPQRLGPPEGKATPPSYCWKGRG